MKKSMYFLTKYSLRNMKQPIIIQGRTGKISASSGVTEPVAWNRCSYQVPDMVVTNASTNKNHKFYKLMVLAISIVGRDFSQS